MRYPFISTDPAFYIVGGVILWSVLPFFVSRIFAYRRGRSTWGWALFSVPFGWFAVVALVLVGEKETTDTD